MFSMTKSRELDEGQSRYIDVNKRHYGEDVQFTKVRYVILVGIFSTDLNHPIRQPR